MAIQKPSIPKGTRDFSPTEVAKRNFIINTIKNAFNTFGFQPIETPSFENYNTLMGKYGEEGDRLIFKILNSGDFTQGVNQEDWEAKNPQKLTPQLSEKALRYDLTVPFARYVVWQEVEFVQLYDSVFTALNLKGVTIKINNRKILSGFAEMIGESDKLIDFTVALDKLDKIGEEGVIKEMKERGISEEAIAKLQPIFALKGSFAEKLSALKEILKNSETGLKGVEELEFIAQQINQLGLQTAILDLDVTLARGLNYYTGAIFEIAAPAGVQMGSIGGGGRYDDLTSIFGLKGMSGIGISFGLDRIGLVMEELNLFPESLNSTVEVLCINFGDAEALQSMKLLKALRQLGKTAELYPDATKIKKQMDYANKRNIPYVVIIGESELANNTFVLKNMLEGTQKECSLNEVSNALFQ